MFIVENSVERVENFLKQAAKIQQRGERTGSKKNFLHQALIFLMMSSTVSRIRVSVSMARAASLRE